jgi:hypothetical protein
MKRRQGRRVSIPSLISDLSHTGGAHNDGHAALHRALSEGNRRRFVPTWGPEVVDLTAEVDHRRREERFVTSERASLQQQLQAIPSDADRFVSWFEGLLESGPGQDDALFPWLATQASLDDMRWFLRQEVAGEAGFDDLVALTQRAMPPRVKLEMGRNLWDELGRGRAVGMHGPMLDRLSATLGLRFVTGPPVWESEALGNLMVALAWNRHYAYHAIGALGVIELTAPGRAARVNEGLRRLDVPPRARQYFALHATLDVRHSAAWNCEVLKPLVAADPRCARPIAEGALLRLNAGLRCFSRYREQLWA